MRSMEKIPTLMKFIDSKRRSSLKKSFHTMNAAWRDFEEHFDSSEKMMDAALQAIEDDLNSSRKSIADSREEFELMRKAMESRLEEIERREAEFDLFQRERMEYLRMMEDRLEARFSEGIDDTVSMESKVMGSRSREFDVQQKLNQESRMGIQFKGKQFEELELRNKQLELQLAETRELLEQEKIKRSIQPTRTPWDSFSHGIVPDLSRLSTDPARLLLDSMQCCFVSILKNDMEDANNSMVIFLPLLKEIVKSTIQIRIPTNIQPEALSFALDWKAFFMFPKGQEAFCFLLFLSIYKLGPWFSDEELVHLLCECSNDLSGYLLREFGLEQKMVEYIQKLVAEEQQLLEVVGYIYDFGLVSEFSPVSLLKDYYLSSATAAARELYNRDNNVESKAKALEEELIVVQGVIKCIVHRGLESLFPIKSLRRRANYLLKKMGCRKIHDKDTPPPYNLRSRPEKPSQVQNQDRGIKRSAPHPVLKLEEDRRMKKQCCDGSSS